MASLIMFLTILALMIVTCCYAQRIVSPSRHVTRQDQIVREMIAVDKHMNSYFEDEVITNAQLRTRQSIRAPDQTGAIFSMPVAGFIPWGRTHCNSSDNPQNYYTNIQDQSYKTVVYFVNEILGGILLNGSRYLINDINHNDGADCSLMVILYQYMVDVQGAKFLFAPVNPDCSVLSKFAESRGILFGNAGDYSLLIERLTPGFQTANDYLLPGASLISYSNLNWTYNLMNNIAETGQSCGEALTNPMYINQSQVPAGEPPAQVRTAVFASNEAELPYLAPETRGALLERNVTEVYPEQDWDLASILSQGCAYLQPTINAWIAAKPDLVFLVTGASNGSIGFNCIHESLYQPPVTMMPTLPSDFPFWQTAGLVNEVPFVATIDFTDPIFGNYSTFASLYTQMWGYGPTFYELTFASSAIVLLDCIITLQNMDDNLALLDCIRNFNKTTIYGQINFNPNGWYVDRPDVCTQQQENGTYTVAFPKDYPLQFDLQIPFPFQYNQTFLDSLKKPDEISTNNKIIIGVLVPIGAIIIIVLIVLFIIRKKFHMIFVPKAVGKEEGEW